MADDRVSSTDNKNISPVFPAPQTPLEQCFDDVTTACREEPSTGTQFPTYAENPDFYASVVKNEVCSKVSPTNGVWNIPAQKTFHTGVLAALKSAGDCDGLLKVYDKSRKEVLDAKRVLRTITIGVTAAAAVVAGAGVIALGTEAIAATKTIEAAELAAASVNSAVVGVFGFLGFNQEGTQSQKDSDAGHRPGRKD